MDMIEQQKQKVLIELDVLISMVEKECAFDWWKFPAGIELISARSLLVTLRNHLSECDLLAVLHAKQGATQ